MTELQAEACCRRRSQMVADGIVEIVGVLLRDTRPLPGSGKVVLHGGGGDTPGGWHGGSRQGPLPLYAPVSAAAVYIMACAALVDCFCCRLHPAPVGGGGGPLLGSRGQGSLTQGPPSSPCRPWASLLVAGIKRIEGRGWATDHRGLLWIASTAQEPSAADVEEMEAFYATVHGLEGRSLTFPEAYPTGVLLGCVQVMDCLSAEQVEGWGGLPESVVMEVGSPFCFLCSRPERLVVPQQMRGWPKIFALEKKVHQTAKLQRRPAALPAPAWDWGDCGAPPASTAALPESSNKSKFAARMAAAGYAGRLDKLSGGEPKAPKGGHKAKKGAPETAPAAAAQSAPAAPATIAEEDLGQLTVAELEKRARGLNKKLRQVDVLREWAAPGGRALSAEETAKMQSEERLRADLRLLEQHLANK